MDPSTQKKYLIAFLRLKHGITKYGLAPHKPVLLITLIELVEKGLVLDNNFCVGPDLVGTFKENWELLVPTMHQPDFTQPFFYLQSEKIDGEPYWFLQPRPGCQINSHISSVSTLAAVCEKGYFAAPLFAIMLNKTENAVLTNKLLDHYFREQKTAFLSTKRSGDGYLHQQELSIMNEPEARQKHISIHTEEDVFVRNGLFKKLVPQAYQNRWSFTGMKLSSTFGHSFIDACHIIPFSITHNDSINNGIALCPNLHRAFDRGLVSLDNDYKILVSEHIYEEENHPYGLKQLRAKRIHLPVKQNTLPNLEYLF